MKGKAIIQMINPFTKKVEEEFEEKNIITNAIKNAFYLPPQWQRGLLSSSGIINWQNNLCPLNRNGLGGILLWDETIPENVETVVPPMSVNNVGFAGGNYSGANAFKGTLNSLETVALSNGWRNVWDFDTSKCNGKTIKCLSLTNVNCGNNGWNTYGIGNNEYASSGWIIETGGFFEKEGDGDKIIGFVDSVYESKEDYNTILCCKYLTSSSFKFYKRRKPNLNSLKINDFNLSYVSGNFDEVTVDFGVNNYYRESKNSIKIENNLHIVNYWNNTTLEHIIVNLSDYSFTRNLISTSGHSKSISTSGAKIFFEGKYFVGCSDDSNILLDENGVFIKNLPFGAGDYYGYNFYTYDERLFFTYNRTQNPSNERITELTEDKVKYNTGSSSRGRGILVDSNLRYPLAFYYNNENSSNSGIMASNYYLGSINNLATPITKTSDFNMKIIYEITD
jgi:hypothetical protein